MPRHSGPFRWLRRLRPLCWLAGAFLLVIGVYGLWQGANVHPAFDVGHLCRSGQSEGCGRLRPATSQGLNSLGDLRVAFGDQDVATVPWRSGPYPAPGTALRVEYWDGDPVSVYDVHRELRYKGLYWPEPNDPYAWIIVVLGLALLAAALGLERLRRLGGWARDLVQRH